MIQYIKRKDLDVAKYDACIKDSLQTRVYAFSWYLDIVADNWDVLVLDDYKAVMPIPWRRKYGLKYTYPPFWIIELGVFSTIQIDEDLFLKKLLKAFNFVEIRTNTKNFFSLFKEHQQKRDLQVLNLKLPYNSILDNFRKDRKKDLLKAQKKELQIKQHYTPKELLTLHKNNVGKRVKEFKEKDYKELYTLMQYAIDYKKADILSVYDKNNSLVASGFFLKDNNRIVKLISSTDFNNRKNGANTFLIERALYTYYKEFDFFDFGGSSMKSIASFNLSFGSETEHYTQISYRVFPKLFQFFKR